MANILPGMLVTCKLRASHSVSESVICFIRSIEKEKVAKIYRIDYLAGENSILIGCIIILAVFLIS